MAESSARFTCSSCGKHYIWKPELAGKKVKCKCGQVLAVPAAPQEPAPDDDLFDLAPDPDAQNRPVTRAVTAAAATAAHASNAPAHPVHTAPAGPAAAAVATAEQAHSTTPRTSAVPNRAHGVPARMQPIHMDESLDKRKLALILGVIVFVIACVVVGKMLLSKAAKPKPPALADDATVQAGIDDEHGMDMQQWLDASPRHMFPAMSSQQAARWAQGAKDKGAVRVWTWGDVAQLQCALELPSDPAKRKDLFELSQAYRMPGKPPNKDVGQKYILITFPLGGP